MRKFINEHAGLYWAIVILVAGLVFGIVTGIGCAKLEKAEAATEVSQDLIDYAISLNRGIDNIVILADTYGQYYTFVENQYNDTVLTNGNYKVTVYANCGVPTLVSPNWWTGKWYLISVNSSNQVSYLCGTCTGMHLEQRGLQIVYSSKPVLASGQADVDGDGIYYENVVINEPTYLVNAPYLEYQSVESQSNFVNEKIYDIDEGYHIVNYKIAGQPMTPPDGYKALYEYRVYLPTKDYFYQYLRDDLLIDLDGLNTMQSNIPKWRRNSVGSSDSKLWIFNLDRSIEAEKTNGDDVRIRLDYADIQTEIEEFNSVSLKEYYGFDDDAWGAYGKYIMAHLVVYRVDCIVYTYNTPDIYYGRNITTIFPPYLDKTIVTEYNGDYFNPDYDYDAEVDAEIEQALKDAKAESDALVEEYQNMINNQENTFGSFDSEFADVGLWGALRGIGSGFLGLTGFIANFAILVGGIFSFVPIAFQQYVGYTLLAILLIGLWKTIKG